MQLPAFITNPEMALFAVYRHLEAHESLRGESLSPWTLQRATSTHRLVGKKAFCTQWQHNCVTPPLTTHGEPHRVTL